jgi:hypothetical protein
MTPAVTAIRDGAIGVAIFIVLAIITAIISANVRHWAQAKKYDTYFLRAWNLIADMLPGGWTSIRQLWWAWLCLGLSAGLGVALLLLQPADLVTSVTSKSIGSDELVERWMLGAEAAEAFGPPELVRNWQNAPATEKYQASKPIAENLQLQLKEGKLIAQGRVMGLVQDVPTVIGRAQWQYLVIGKDDFSVAYSHDRNMASYTALEIGKARGR